jgi:hypothetical protein
VDFLERPEKGPKVVHETLPWATSSERTPVFTRAESNRMANAKRIGVTSPESQSSSDVMTRRSVGRNEPHHLGVGNRKKEKKEKKKKGKNKTNNFEESCWKS